MAYNLDRPAEKAGSRYRLDRLRELAGDRTPGMQKRGNRRQNAAPVEAAPKSWLPAQSYTSQREGVTYQLPRIDQCGAVQERSDWSTAPMQQDARKPERSDGRAAAAHCWNAGAAMPAAKELAGKVANFGTNFLIPAKGMAQGAKLLFGEPETGFDPEAERRALTQMGNAQKGAERVALGLNAIAETPGASVRYLGETAAQAGRNILETVQNPQWRGAMAQGIGARIAPNEGSAVMVWSDALGRSVMVPRGTKPEDYTAAWEQWQAANQPKIEARQQAEAALSGLGVDRPVAPGSAASRMMGQAQAKRQAAVEGLSPTGQFLGSTAISIGQNASVMPLAAIHPSATLGAMGVIAGADKAYEVQQQGGGATEALARGVVSGGIEVLTERMPLDHLMKIVKTPAGKELVKNIVKQMGIESAEEAASYVGNYIADVAFRDPNAEFSLKEMLLAGLGGVISGGVFAGGGTMLSALNSGKPGNLIAPSRGDTGMAIDVDGAQGVDASIADLLDPLERSKVETPAQAVDQKQDARSVIAKLRESIPELQGDTVVSKLTGNEFSKGSKKLTETVGEFFRSLGNKVFRNGFGDVIIDERGIKDDIAHGLGRAKAVTFAAVPNVITKGRQIDYQTNWKGRGKDSYVFAAPVQIGGKQAVVAAVVLKDATNRFYLHEVLDQNGETIYRLDEKEDSAPSRPGITAQNGFTGELNPSISILSQEHGSVNEEVPVTTAPKNAGLVQNQNAQRISRRVRRVFDATGKALGISIVADDTLHGDNGLYDAKTKTLRIALDAQDPLRIVFTHEITHRLKETSPRLYGQFEQLAVEAMQRTGTYDRVQLAVQQAYGAEASTEEAVAHFTRILTEDIREFERLMGVNRNLAQKLFDALDAVLHRGRINWDGPADVDQDLLFGQYAPKELQRLRDAWAKALKAADPAAEGSENAKKMFVLPTDQRTIERAEQMEREGNGREAIWQETGLIRDAKGNWITEIDDSGAKFFPQGDAQRMGNPDYARYKELETKMLYGTLTQAEQQEVQRLSKVIKGIPTGHNLSAYLDHPELYGRLSGIESTPFARAEMERTRGQSGEDGIRINQGLRGDDAKRTTLHEAQHQEQRMEGRPRGASPEYYRARQRGAGDPHQLYENTAGEIEARETARRANMTAEERRQNMPDLGWERAIFAESARSYLAEQTSIKEQIKANQDMLNKMDPVATVSSADIRGKGTGEIRAIIIDKLRSTNYQIERQGLGRITFSPKELNTSLNYLNSEADAAAYAALPTVLRRGIVIEDRSNHKGRGYGTITIAAPVSIDEKRGNMAVVVKKTNGNHYKMHRVLTPNGSLFLLSDTEKQSLPPARGLDLSDTHATPISSVSDTTLPQTAEGVNPNSMQSERKYSRPLGPEEAQIKRNRQMARIRAAAQAQEEHRSVIEQNAEAAVRQAYISKMLTEKRLLQQLRAAKAAGMPDKQFDAYLMALGFDPRQFQ